MVLTILGHILPLTVIILMDSPFQSLLKPWALQAHLFALGPPSPGHTLLILHIHHSQAQATLPNGTLKA